MLPTSTHRQKTATLDNPEAQQHWASNYIQWNAHVCCYVFSWHMGWYTVEDGKLKAKIRNYLWFAKIIHAGLGSHGVHAT